MEAGASPRFSRTTATSPPESSLRQTSFVELLLTMTPWINQVLQGQVEIEKDIESAFISRTGDSVLPARRECDFPPTKQQLT